MPVFRNQRKTGFTTVNNAFVRDKTLSWKAKGVLLAMLSMPDDWSYNMKWLVTQAKDQMASLSKGIEELVEAGYITRARTRDERGRLQDIEYFVYDEPQKSLELQENSPKRENRVLDETSDKSPKRDFPILDNQGLGNPILENRELLNTNIELSTNSTNHSFTQSIDRLSEEVRIRIGYSELLLDCNYDTELIDTIVAQIVEVESSRSLYTRIGSRDIPTSLVKSKLRDLTTDVVRDGAIEPYYRYAMKNDISNPRALMLSFLYNATATYGLGNLASEAQAAAVSVRTHIPE